MSILVWLFEYLQVMLSAYKRRSRFVMNIGNSRGGHSIFFSIFDTDSSTIFLLSTSINLCYSEYEGSPNREIE